MTVLHLFLICLQLFTCLLVVISRNPIHSILFLVLLFVESAMTLIVLEIDLFALLLIIIYVGAIAILFLFVIMMLKLKVEFANFLKYIPFLVIFSYFFFFNALDIFQSFFSFFDLRTNYFTDFKFENMFDDLSLLAIIGQCLYNYYIVYVLIAGFLLLIALIGAIILTINLNKSRSTNLSFRRLSKTDKTLSYFE